MIIVAPVPVTEATLFSSNVTETEHPLWSAGSYTVGQLVIFGHRIYEALSTTSAQPDVGAVAVPPTWLDLGPTNLYRMFDEGYATQTSNPGTVEARIRPGVVINAVALLNCMGNSATVEVIDPVDGVVYSETKPLQDNTLVGDWYAYFYEPIASKADIAFLNLPNYGSADINILVDAGAGTAAIGSVVQGRQRIIGVANYGTSVGITDYSRKERDDFGNFVIVPRGFAKRAEYDVTVESAQIGMVQRALSNLLTTAAVYIADTEREETIVYGFFKDFNIVIATPSISSCSIQVEGLT